MSLPESSHDKEVILITGANTGLGLEIVKSLYKAPKPYSIILGTRSIEKGTTAVATIQGEIPSSPSSLTVIQLDISSDTSISSALARISTDFSGLDVLINNAGANYEHQLRDGLLGIREAWNKSWDTNVAGTQVLTHGAIPLLLESQNPRLLFITSGTSTLTMTENFSHPSLQRINASPSAGWPKPPEINPLESYRSAKTGLNMMMRQWHRILLNDKVKVWAVSPGFLATGLNGIGVVELKKMGARDPSEGGNFVAKIVQGERDQDVGKVVYAAGVQPW